MLSTLVLTDQAAHWGGPYFGGPFGGGFSFLFLLVPLFWIGVIALLFALARRRRRAWAATGYAPGGFGHSGWGHGSWGNPGFGGGSRSAESTLAERFAQGDIEEVEYRARLEVLRANSFPQQPAA